MVRSVLVAFVALTFVASATLGQAPPKSITWPSLFVGWEFVDISQLNVALQNQGYPALPENFFIFGNTYSLLPLLQSPLATWTFGIVSWQGSASSKTDRSLARLSFVGSGAFAEYHPSLPPQARYGLAISMVMGVGFTNLFLVREPSASFEDALRSPANVLLSRWFFIVQPQVSISWTVEIVVPIPLKLSIGYMLTFDNGAWDQEGRALKGPPDRFNGWNIQLSLGS